MHYYLTPYSSPQRNFTFATNTPRAFPTVQNRSPMCSEITASTAMLFSLSTTPCYGFSTFSPVLIRRLVLLTFAYFVVQTTQECRPATSLSSLHPPSVFRGISPTNLFNNTTTSPSHVLQNLSIDTGSYAKSTIPLALYFSFQHITCNMPTKVL